MSINFFVPNPYSYIIQEGNFLTFEKEHYIAVVPEENRLEQQLGVPTLNNADARSIADISISKTIIYK